MRDTEFTRITDAGLQNQIDMNSMPLDDFSLVAWSFPMKQNSFNIRA